MKRNLFVAVLLLTIFLPALSWAQMDKALHTSAGFGITFSVAAASNKPKVGLLIGLGAGLGKELWDSTQPKHTASANDFFATAAGSASAYVLYRYVFNRHRPVKVAAVDMSDHPAPPPLRRPAATESAKQAAPATQSAPVVVPQPAAVPTVNADGGQER